MATARILLAFRFDAKKHSGTFGSDRCQLADVSFGCDDHLHLKSLVKVWQIPYKSC